MILLVSVMIAPADHEVESQMSPLSHVELRALARVLGPWAELLSSHSIEFTLIFPVE